MANVRGNRSTTRNRTKTDTRENLPDVGGRPVNLFPTISCQSRDPYLPLCTLKLTFRRGQVEVRRDGFPRSREINRHVTRWRKRHSGSIGAGLREEAENVPKIERQTVPRQLVGAADYGHTETCFTP